METEMWQYLDRETGEARRAVALAPWTEPVPKVDEVAYSPSGHVVYTVDGGRSYIAKHLA